MPTIFNAPSSRIPAGARSLVIGATGQLGSQIVRALCGRGHRVRALRRWNSSTERLAALAPELVVGDMLDRHSLHAAMSGCNYVFFAAAPSPGLAPAVYLQHSVIGIRNVIEVARDLGVERIVVTSSASTVALRADRTPAREDDVYLPGTTDDVFVEAKYAIEQECYRYGADGADVVILNPTLLCGPGIDLEALTDLGLDAGRRVNFVDVRKAADAHVRALERGERSERYVVGEFNATVADLLQGWQWKLTRPSARVRRRRKARSTRTGAAVLRERYQAQCGQWYDLSKARALMAD